MCAHVCCAAYAPGQQLHLHKPHRHEGELFSLSDHAEEVQVQEQPPRCRSDLEISAGDLFEAGWLVVKVQWYRYAPTHNKGLQRAYSLLPGEKTIAVNPLLRILGVSCLRWVLPVRVASDSCAVVPNQSKC